MLVRGWPYCTVRSAAYTRQLTNRPRDGARRYEFADTEAFIKIGEELMTPYEWGRYDILLLPPSFPCADPRPPPPLCSHRWVGVHWADAVRLCRMVLPVLVRQPAHSMA